MTPSIAHSHEHASGFSPLPAPPFHPMPSSITPISSSHHSYCFQCYCCRAQSFMWGACVDCNFGRAQMIIGGEHVKFQSTFIRPTCHRPSIAPTTLRTCKDLTHPLASLRPQTKTQPLMPPLHCREYVRKCDVSPVMNMHRLVHRCLTFPSSTCLLAHPLPSPHTTLHTTLRTTHTAHHTPDTP